MLLVATILVTDTIMKAVGQFHDPGREASVSIKTSFLYLSSFVCISTHHAEKAGERRAKSLDNILSEQQLSSFCMSRVF